MMVKDGIDVDARHLQVTPELGEHIQERLGVVLLGHERTSDERPGAASHNRT